MAKSVVVGLSGGVDSAVSAWLLQQQGYDVRAFFMRNWDDDGSPYCTAGQDFIDACGVAEFLGIPISVANFTREYKERVFNQCLELLKRGLTPNPDVWCNSQIKFGAFLDFIGDSADYVATGHYARVEREANSQALTRLFRAVDATKDQSYFLHQLNQDQLGRCLFPLGTWHKSQVREKAQAIGLPNYNRPDSTGICFIGERPYADFLQEFLPKRPGDIVNPDGQVLGTHQGLYYYTLGQRKGLGIGGSRDGNGGAWYVAAKDNARNRLIVVQGEDHPLLYNDGLIIQSMHWIDDCFDRQKLVRAKAFATIRYRQQPQPCCVECKQEDGSVELLFSEPQKAITPGQFAVIYVEDECVGGGMIQRPLRFEADQTLSSVALS